MSGSGMVIVGACQAGYQVALSLREGGYEGPVTLIGEEPGLPYQRPPLSKGFLLGKTDEQRLLFRPETFYESHDIEVVPDTRIVSLDRVAKRVTAEDGRTFSYDGLALATGARVRTLPVPGADLDGVCYVRTLADSQHIRERMEQVQTVVVIGAGFIGLEVAAVLVGLGRKVTVLEAQDRVMPRVVAPIISEHYAAVHRGHGVDLRLQTQVTEIVGRDGRAVAVRTGDGAELPADLVVVGIGVIPNQELAQDAGIACENGIIVDDRARTSDPAVVAAGDCARHPNRYAGGEIRLESVQNAGDQARIAAASLLGDSPPYDAVPWFWTDQYDLKLQMVGFSAGYDRTVLRGEIGDGKFSVFYFKGPHLCAIDSVNKPADHMVGRKLFAAGVEITPEQAADLEFNLKALV